MIKRLEMRSKIAKFSPEFWRRKVGEKLLFLLNTTYSFQNIWKKKSTLQLQMSLFIGKSIREGKSYKNKMRL
jgi:hypothetical protein